MRPLRSSIVTVLLLALATVPTTGVAAQGEASREPSAVLGWALDETHVWDGTSKEVDGVLQRRGPQYSYTWTADDPRLSGEALWTGSGDRYRASPTFEVQTATWELVNDDGRWVGESVGLQGPGLGESDTITLTGEGAYEGLGAIVIMDWGLGGGRFRGAIFPGEMPPLP